MIRARRDRNPGAWLLATLFILGACGTEDASPPRADADASTNKAAAESPMPVVAARAEYMTRAACQDCHAKEVEAWATIFWIVLSRSASISPAAGPHNR